MILSLSVVLGSLQRQPSSWLYCASRTMPGVTLNSNSPSLSALDPLHPCMSLAARSSLASPARPTASTDQFSPYANMSVTDIKNRAKETVFKEASKASPLSLIRTAHNQIVIAKEKESVGDLHGALESYIKTATLIKMTMDSSEFKQERTKGVLRKEVQDFLNVCRCLEVFCLFSSLSLSQGAGRDLSARTQNVEDRLKTFEANKQSCVAHP